MIETRGGDILRDTGSLPTLLVRGEDTGGRFALVESVESRGCEPPFHLHNREDELVYVLEGRVSFHLEGERLDCPAGTCVLLPKGREHTYVVESGQARLLVMLLPAGLEDYYQELGSWDGSAQGGPLDLEWLVTVAARYGVEITGPPPEPGEGKGVADGAGLSGPSGKFQAISAGPVRW